MKLYLANGRYVGTQAEARRADRNFVPVVVPVDKDGLIAYLNGLARAPAPCSTAAPSPHAAVEQPYRDRTIERDLAAMDAPGVNVDQIVETILTSKGYALGRFAKAVAVRFGQMEGRLS
jgi:hypothetical protein